MNAQTPATAVVDSYPTFWDATPPQAQPATPMLAEDAYSAFVNLAEDEFPSGEFPMPPEAGAKPDAD